ncbi:hypothetical protein RUESEDTHA_01558 [Ruegeria sp. THAF57]|nr:hypothetical protein RUESEDTHA_01558 [Ruegeria sp. THAF57]
MDAEIAEKHKSRDLLEALLGQSNLKDWHEEVERVAPNTNMAGFLEIFAGPNRWGSGTAEATRRCLHWRSVSLRQSSKSYVTLAWRR